MNQNGCGFLDCPGILGERSFSVNDAELQVLGIDFFHIILDNHHSGILVYKTLIVYCISLQDELLGKRRPDTAATQFKTSLVGLMSILMSKEPSYIRCIKPNDDKRSCK